MIPPPPLKLELEKAERSIKTQLYRLDALLAKLKESNDRLFNRINMNIQKRDNAHAVILANELVEARKMMRMVAEAKYALEAIALRIETARDLGEIATTLAPAVAAVKNVQRGVAGVIPMAAENFTEITGLLSGILVDAGQSGEITLDFEAANEDAEKIISEAAALAEKNLRQKIPAIPPDVPEYVSHALKEALA